VINPEIFPVIDAITLATPEDAQRLSRILNELYDEISRLIHQVNLKSQEMDALWIHVRNLEEKLLNPSEYGSEKVFHNACSVKGTKNQRGIGNG
jgi:hypothetical protein